MRLLRKISDRTIMVHPSRLAGPGAKVSGRITRDDVNKAIRELIHENVKVTVDTVRARLGSGSMTTVSRYIKDWEKSKHETLGKSPLEGDTGSAYLVSKNFLPAGQQEVASIVINGIHMILDIVQARRIVAAADAIKAGGAPTSDAPVQQFQGEFFVSVQTAGPVMFTCGPEFVQRLAEDLKYAGA